MCPNGTAWSPRPPLLHFERINPVSSFAAIGISSAKRKEMNLPQNGSMLEGKNFAPRCGFVLRHVAGMSRLHRKCHFVFSTGVKSRFSWP